MGTRCVRPFCSRRSSCTADDVERSRDARSVELRRADARAHVVGDSRAGRPPRIAPSEVEVGTGARPRRTRLACPIGRDRRLRDLEIGAFRAQALSRWAWSAAHHLRRGLLAELRSVGRRGRSRCARRSRASAHTRSTREPGVSHVEGARAHALVGDEARERVSRRRRPESPAHFEKNSATSVPRGGLQCPRGAARSRRRSWTRTRACSPRPAAWSFWPREGGNTTKRPK